MPQFFIDRPVFAWVIAIIITLGGVFAIRSLPAEAYRTCAPRSISATYPAPMPTSLSALSSGHRAAAHGHRQPDVLLVVVSNGGGNHAVLRVRHESGHRSRAGQNRVTLPSRVCRVKWCCRACRWRR